MADYSKMTDEDFRRILEDIVCEEGANILSIGDVYSELAEHFNNEVLERWEEEQGYDEDDEDEEKETTLTTENIELGLKIQCTDHPEWGEWTVKEKYAGGIWVLWGSRSNTKVLVESELHFWEIVSEEE